MIDTYDLIIEIKNGTEELDLVLNRLSDMGYLWNGDGSSLKKWKPFLEVFAICLRKNRGVVYGDTVALEKGTPSMNAEAFLRITACFEATDHLYLKKLIGKTVRITKNCSGHNLKIGSAAFIVDAEGESVQAIGYTKDGTANVFYLVKDDFEVIEDE